MAAHNATSVTRMWDPTKRFRKLVRGIDDSWDMTQDNVTGVFPVLNGEVLDVNVTRAISRLTAIDDMYSRHVVFVHGSGTGLGEAQLVHNSSEAPSVFCSKYGSWEFCFGGACSCDGLSLCVTGGGTSTEEECTTGGRAHASVALPPWTL